MFSKGYLVSGIGLLALYGWLIFIGWELGTEPRERLPQDANLRQGDYRIYLASHGGYRGGK